MYHPINRFDCPELTKLNTLARLTLIFGLECTYPNLDADNPTDVQLSQIRQDFCDHFAQANFVPASIWLWGKPVAIREPLLKLLAIPLPDKQGILEAYDADNDLEARFAEGRFHAGSIPSASAAAATIAKSLLLNFYTRILADDGAPAEYLVSTTALDRQVVLNAYRNAQRQLRLKVCPGCDGQPPSVTRRKDYAELDHFFHKAKHQFLAIHPLNLTPFCDECNGDFKGQKDAIADGDAAVADVTNLSEIYHPYFRPARDEVEVRIERAVGDGKPRVRLTSRATEPQATARLHSLNYLLGLEERWDGALQDERVHEKFDLLLLHNSQDERAAGNNFDMAWIQAHIATVEKTVERGIGREPGSVVTLAYARWVASDQAETQRWLDVWKEHCHAAT